MSMNPLKKINSIKVRRSCREVKSNKESQQHQNKKKLQRSDASEVVSSSVFTFWAKKDVLKEGELDGFLGHSVVNVEYTENREG